jgi:hypothetical protein
MKNSSVPTIGSDSGGSTGSGITGGDAFRSSTRAELGGPGIRNWRAAAERPVMGVRLALDFEKQNCPYTQLASYVREAEVDPGVP